MTWSASLVQSRQILLGRLRHEKQCPDRAIMRFTRPPSLPRPMMASGACLSGSCAAVTASAFGGTHRPERKVPPGIARNPLIPNVAQTDSHQFGLVINGGSIDAGRYLQAMPQVTQCSSTYLPLAQPALVTNSSTRSGVRIANSAKKKLGAVQRVKPALKNAGLLFQSSNSVPRGAVRR